jgi:hypothetical protein
MLLFLLSFLTFDYRSLELYASILLLSDFLYPPSDFMAHCEASSCAYNSAHSGSKYGTNSSSNSAEHPSEYVFQTLSLVFRCLLEFLPCHLGVDGGLLNLSLDLVYLLLAFLDFNQLLR